MLIRKFLNSKKGISSITATLLLIVIAVTVIAVTYAGTTTYIGSATSQAEVILCEENICFDTGATEITMSNSETEDTQIARMWFGDSSGNMTDITIDTDTAGAGKLLIACGIVTITIYWPNGIDSIWEEGKNYNFRIVPNSGQFYEFQEQAPQQQTFFSISLYV